MSHSRRWRLQPQSPELCSRIASELSVHPLVAQVLLNRGISSSDLARLFLKPSIDQLHDPFLLPGMDKAVQRLRLACLNSEKVLVYGDYDVDGVTSTAVVWRYLRSIGLEAFRYIPHRMEEGYGLNSESVSVIKDQGVSLVITVDCGVTSREQIQALKDQGIDTIVIDHHEPEEGAFPQAAVAVIDPKCEGSTYPFRDLAGVGLAAKFVHAASGKFPLHDLDLITLGTIADVVPLRGENRIIVQAGLGSIYRTTKAGLRALIRLARIEGKPVTTYTVGFTLGPRLNAAGRMGTAKTSLDLLLCEDDADSDGLAGLLEEHNRERQKIQNSVFEQAAAMIEDDSSFREQKVLVVHGDNWHRGVLGIAASKLTDRYARPAVVISFLDGLGTGSARSIEGFHLNEAFAACASVLESFGGHSRAAGLKVRRDKVSDLRSLINAFASKNLVADLLPVIDVDAQLPLGQVSMELLGQLSALEPYGEANPSPIFATRHLRLKTSVQVMGKETVKFWVTDGRVACQAVGFGMAKVCSEFKIGQPVDIVYNLAVDDWNKVAQPQLTLKDIRPGRTGQKQ